MLMRYLLANMVRSWGNSAAETTLIVTVPKMCQHANLKALEIDCPVILLDIVNSMKAYSEEAVKVSIWSQRAAICAFVQCFWTHVAWKAFWNSANRFCLMCKYQWHYKIQFQTACLCSMTHYRPEVQISTHLSFLEYNDTHPNGQWFIPFHNDTMSLLRRSIHQVSISH